MNRKLFVLDVALAAGVLFGGIQLREHWVAAKARQAQMPGPAVKPAPVAPMPPLPAQPAVLPSDFKKVAIDTLFDPSRNPNVPVDPPPPKEVPPPKEPPPLPDFHGSMDLGSGPFALMTEAGKDGYQYVHAGQMIGPFKLLSFNRKEFAVEWEGKEIHKRLGDMNGEKPKANGQAAAAAAAMDAFKPAPGVIPGQAPADNAQQAQPVQGQALGPGVQMTDTERACQAGDSTPDGAVSGGYRKVHDMNPLGSRCVWRAVGR